MYYDINVNSSSSRVDANALPSVLVMLVSGSVLTFKGVYEDAASIGYELKGVFVEVGCTHLLS